MVRPRFDPTLPLVAARDFMWHGNEYAAGDAFPLAESKPDPTPREARTLYDGRYVNHGEPKAAGGTKPPAKAPAARKTAKPPAKAT